MLLGTFTLSATLLLVNQLVWFAVAAAGLAAVSGIALIRLMMRISRAERMP
ncbi:MAG: hypothetical protein F6J97_12470 [Leptolyngbya sp. SIO4C1]|nr:hypothetical protein [Leptolyngbya sp. SIO4C1]